MGIYQVVSHTENKAGCDAEGPPASSTAPFFFVRKEKFLGFDYYALVGCETLDACRMDAKEEDAFSQFQFTFDEVKSGTELAGSTRTTGFSSASGICTEPAVSDRSFARSEDAVRIEERTRIGDDYPADKDGFCSTDLGEKATKGKPCSEYVVVTATYVEPLPK